MLFRIAGSLPCSFCRSILSPARLRRSLERAKIHLGRVLDPCLSRDVANKLR